MEKNIANQFVIFNFNLVTLGISSRGKAHVLRLAVTVHLHLNFWNMYKNEKPNEEAEVAAEHSGDLAFGPQPSDDSEFGVEEDSNTEQHNVDIDDPEIQEEDDPELQNGEEKPQYDVIGSQTIAVAASIVTTCLTQLCKFPHIRLAISSSKLM